MLKFDNISDARYYGSLYETGGGALVALDEHQVHISREGFGGGQRGYIGGERIKPATWWPSPR